MANQPTAAAPRFGPPAPWGVLVPLLLLLLLPRASAQAGGFDPRLAYLLHVHGELGRGTPGDLLRGYPGLSMEAVADRLRQEGSRESAAALLLASGTEVPGSIRFSQEPDQAILRQLTSIGVGFSDFGQRPQGSRTVFPARMPWEALREIAAHPAVQQVACTWRIGAQPPLANSRPQVQADAMWHLHDTQGRPATGRGTLVADFDTGVNYFHPSLFFADGDTLAWIDVDQSGGLTAGDAVDLNDNGLPDLGEALCYFEGTGAEQYGNVEGMYNPSFDWLYNDANENEIRDFGPEFGETQPGYGELLFLTLDTDHDDQLDPGESLVTLATSKIRAVRDREGDVFERGVNLLGAEQDYYGHGTPVSGIVCAGWPGINQMSGIAPRAEMIHAINDYTSEPPFLVPMEEHLVWAATYDPDVFLIEDGEWIWQYMDGSSNLETMLNEYAADEGIIVVVPAGNLYEGQMHTLLTTDQPAILHMVFPVDVCWLDFLWLEANSPEVALTVPGGSSSLLDLGGTTQVIGVYEIYSSFSVSPRGTHRIDVRIEHEVPGTPLQGDYRFDFLPQRPADRGCVVSGGEERDHFELHGYFWDNVSGWFSVNRWDQIDPAYTVTWPATADSAISVAAYDPDGDGDINSFSGCGPRIDGRPAVDIAAPGSVVQSLHAFSPGEYASFGGTSAAGPHVAGAAALFKQLVADLESGMFRAAIHAGAQVDPYTIDPNRWGAGKLRIFDALLSAADVARDPPAAPGGVQLSTSPTPCTSSALITFRTPRAGGADLSILDCLGRVLLRRHLTADGHGLQVFTWNSRDGRGRLLPTGVYYARVSQGEARAERKIVLLR